MTDHDALVRDALRDVADVAPRPPSVAQLEGHRPLPHGAPRWVNATVVAIVLVALGALVLNWAAKMGDDADYVTGGPETTSVATSTTAGIYIDPAIGEWSDRIAGHTISYTATISCGICESYGRWQITERDGTIISATFLDTDRPTPQTQPYVLSAALKAALRADGSVFVKESTDKSVSIEVDVEKNAIDDEFSYDAQDIVIQR